MVDAGNGAGGFYADKVLKVLGADTDGSRYLEPDGMFPNHVPNPENEEAMASICEAVRESNADLGVIFDTDVDRGGAVDSKGNEINRNRLVAVASAIALEGNDGGTIVTDSITSSGLKEFIENNLAQDPLRRKFPFDYRAVTFFGWSFQTIHLRNFLITPDGVSYNPRRQAFWFRLIPFRSPLLGKSRLLSLPPGTEMFQFPGCTLYTLCIQVYIRLHYETWVAPFGNPRI